jgi:hypothetical protein
MLLTQVPKNGQAIGYASQASDGVGIEQYKLPCRLQGANKLYGVYLGTCLAASRFERANGRGYEAHMFQRWCRCRVLGLSGWWGTGVKCMLCMSSVWDLGFDLKVKNGVFWDPFISFSVINSIVYTYSSMFGARQWACVTHLTTTTCLRE